MMCYYYPSFYRATVAGHHRRRGRVVQIYGCVAGCMSKKRSFSYSPSNVLFGARFLLRR